MIRQPLPLPLRNDPAGLGHFGAPRGDRTHQGVDYICTPGLPVLSPCIGYVSKLGYPYSDDLAWRYVELTDTQGLRHRLFYVKPGLELGDRVTPESEIGLAQDITKRYPGQGMTPHVHYEVMKGDRYLNPREVSSDD